MLGNLRNVSILVVIVDFYDHDTPVFQTDLPPKVGMRSEDISRRLMALENAGYIKRIREGRTFTLIPTEMGLKEVRKAFRVRNT